MTEMIQHKIIKCNDTEYMPYCMTCRREFKAGQDRHEWRTYLLYTDVDALRNQLVEYSYRKCGYWVTSCHECFVKNMVQMRDNINEQLESMPECMRELA
jgi:hypothetical protein